VRRYRAITSAALSEVNIGAALSGAALSRSTSVRRYRAIQRAAVAQVLGAGAPSPFPQTPPVGNSNRAANIRRERPRWPARIGNANWRNHHRQTLRGAAN